MDDILIDYLTYVLFYIVVSQFLLYQNENLISLCIPTNYEKVTIRIPV